MNFLEAFLATVVFVLLLNLWLRRPLCKKCGAKAMPNTHTALVKAHHELVQVRRDRARLAAAIYAGDDSKLVLAHAHEVLIEDGWPHDRQSAALSEDSMEG